MTEKIESRLRPIWWLVAAAAVLCVGLWGYFGTDIPLMVGCRVSGGTPTTMPTTLQITSDPNTRPVPVVVTRCMR